MPAGILALLLAFTLPLTDPTTDPSTANPVPVPAATQAPEQGPPLGFLEAWLAGMPDQREMRRGSSEAPMAGAPASTSGDDSVVLDLDEGLTLSFGGQERLRWQSENNKALGNKLPRGNDFFLNRLLVHADLRSDDGWRFYLEGIDARITGFERRPVPGDRNHGDVRNAFFQYDLGDTSVKLGRTDLKFGVERLISPLDWANTRRTFEGAVLTQNLDGSKLDAFVTHPVRINFNDPDNEDDSLWFSGVYGTIDINETDGVDLYGLALNERTSKVVSGAAKTGKLDLYTLGFRAWTKDGPIDADAEVARQFGERARDTIRAYMLAARVGYTLRDLPASPRVGIDFDWASGDSNSTDGTQETFNQLFPLGHAYFGYIDLVGRQNIQDLQPNVTLQLDERTTFKTAFHYFRLDDRHDALYNAGGAPILKDVTGAAGRNVGTELDFTLVRNTSEELGFIDRMLLGYSRFSPGRFVSSQTSNDATRMIYAQFVKNF